MIVVGKHKLHGLVGRSVGSDGILATLVTILLVREVGDDEDEDSGSDCAHCQIGLGMELGIDETREGRRPSQPVVRILPARIHRPLEECRAHEQYKTQQQNEHNVGCAEIRVSKLGFLPPFCNYLLDMSEYVDYRVEKKIPCTKIRVSKLGFLPPFWNTYLEMFNLWILQGRKKKKKKNLQRYDK